MLSPGPATRTTTPIGALLEDLAELGYSVQDIADEVRVHYSTVWRWANGHSEPRQHLNAAIVAFGERLGVHHSGLGATPHPSARYAYNETDLRDALRRAGDGDAPSIGHYTNWRQERVDAGETALPATNTIITRYGSWTAALHACGLTATGRIGGTARRWHHHDIADALARFVTWARHNAVSPSQRNYLRWARTRPDAPGLPTVRAAGNWRHLIDTATNPDR